MQPDHSSADTVTADSVPTAGTVLAFYTEPAAMTSPGAYGPLLKDLPREVPALAAIAQGLLIHEHMAAAYGVPLAEADRASVHVRPVAGLLEQIIARDDRPLTQARVPAQRLPGNCRHFTVLMTAMLRAQGTPARARCGFGGYFATGMFEDHWVCEYWDSARERWRLADAQIDDRQRGWFDIDFDLTDVPRDRFVVAGQAWAQCRSGAADPARYGLSLIGESGDWWIAANLVRDAAALRNVELLPWDCWGAMPGPADAISADLAGLFDRLASLTQDPDTAFAELRQVLAGDERVRVPRAVRNALRDRDEPI
ncbi:MAG TPA: transglutaminase domain-containing protein [Streptosporangiaceae bacterium]|nr:transglutaminase domain-containing protein [Streptosporangiaceae bacterium]